MVGGREFGLKDVASGLDIERSAQHEAHGHEGAVQEQMDVALVGLKPGRGERAHDRPSASERPPDEIPWGKWGAG